MHAKPDEIKPVKFDGIFRSDAHIDLCRYCRKLLEHVIEDFVSAWYNGKFNSLK
jgi:hypothetical protein